MPRTRTINNLGRPTKGAALALRARILLYAASPMNNGNTDFFNIKTWTAHNYIIKNMMNQNGHGPLLPQKM